MMKIKYLITITLFVLIVLISLTLIVIDYNNYGKMIKEIKKQNTDNIVIEGNVVKLDSMSLRQKIAQMITVRGDKEQLLFTNLNVGGVFLDRLKSDEEYKALIEKYQGNSKIKLLVSTDMEGAWTPFPNPKPHQKFPDLSDIKSPEEAYEVGLNHGKVLKDIGFNLNFAPVAEYADVAYGGRVFRGSKEEVKDKIKNYIKGLQENVMGCCKHYPGKTLIKDLHEVSDKQEIEEEDLELFDLCIENDIRSIMIGHPIVTGLLDSNGKPSTVSSEVIGNLEDYNGLIIADEINMEGLKKFYKSKPKLYIDLINSGENFILDFHLDIDDFYKLINNVEKLVEEGKIDEKKIDESVRRILVAKGYEVE